MHEAEYLIKNYEDGGGCYPPRAAASTDNPLQAKNL